MTDYEQKMYDAAKLWLELKERGRLAGEAVREAELEERDVTMVRVDSLCALRKFTDAHTPRRAIIVG